MGQRERIRARKRKRKIEKNLPSHVKKKKQQVTPTDLPYLASPTCQSLLILGDGDLSFTHAVTVHHRRNKGKGIVASIYDSFTECRTKYGDRKIDRMLTILQHAGVQVFDRVDATHRPRSDILSAGPFDRIIFNFPHTGEQRVHLNRQLLDKFFAMLASVKSRLLSAPHGQVHVTLKTKRPYCDWNLTTSANKHGFRLLKALPFNIDWYPGYHHRTTEADASKFEPEHCKTYTFAPIEHPGPIASLATPREASDASSESRSGSQQEASESDQQQEEEEGEEEEEEEFKVYPQVDKRKAPPSAFKTVTVQIHCANPAALKAIIPRDAGLVTPLGQGAWISLDKQQ